MFEFSKNEFETLGCNFSTSKRGGIRYMPFAFTEHGVTMLASVLNFDKAIDMSIAIVRDFLAISHFVNKHKDLPEQVHELRAELQNRSREQRYTISFYLRRFRKSAG